MSIEDDIRDALAAHAGEIDVPARTRAGAHDAITRRVTHARRRRLVAVALGVAALAGAGFGATQLIGNRAPHGFANPGPEPSASSPLSEPTPTGSPNPPAVVTKTYRDDRGYEVSYPLNWDKSEFEGHVEIRPKDFPSLARGEPTFAIDIQVVGGKSNMCAQTTGTHAIGGSSLGGYPATVCETSSPEHRRTYESNWTNSPCAHVSLDCSRGKGISIIVQFIGSTDALWDDYAFMAEDVLPSIKPTGGS